MRAALVITLLLPSLAAQGRIPILGAVIEYPEGRRRVALEYHDAYTEARARVRQVTGGLPPEGLVIELVRDSEALGDAIVREGGKRVPDWVAGVALPAVNRVIIRLDQRSVPRVRVNGVLTHELSHIVVHHMIPRTRHRSVPRWLDEGIAQEAEGRLFRPSDLDLPMRAFFGQLMDLEELESAFPESEGGSELAYAQSRSFVAWLARNSLKEDPIPRLLEALRQGGPLDQAITLTFGLSLDRLEARWREDLRSDRSWMPSFGGKLLLGALLLLAVVLGASRIVIRRNTARRALGEDEEDNGQPEGHRPRRPPIRRLRLA